MLCSSGTAACAATMKQVVIADYGYNLLLETARIKVAVGD